MFLNFLMLRDLYFFSQGIKLNYVFCRKLKTFLSEGQTEFICSLIHQIFTFFSLFLKKTLAFCVALDGLKLIMNSQIYLPAYTVMSSYLFYSLCWEISSFKISNSTGPT